MHCILLSFLLVTHSLEQFLSLSLHSTSLVYLKSGVYIMLNAHEVGWVGHSLMVGSMSCSFGSNTTEVMLSSLCVTWSQYR